MGEHGVPGMGEYGVPGMCEHGVPGRVNYCYMRKYRKYRWNDHINLDFGCDGRVDLPQTPRPCQCHRLGFGYGLATREQRAGGLEDGVGPPHVGVGGGVGGGE